MFRGNKQEADQVMWKILWHCVPWLLALCLMTYTMTLCALIACTLSHDLHNDTMCPGCLHFVSQPTHWHRVPWLPALCLTTYTLTPCALVACTLSHDLHTDTVCPSCPHFVWVTYVLAAHKLSLNFLLTLVCWLCMQVVFEAIRGNDYQSDIAVDLITIHDCSGQGRWMIQPITPYTSFIVSLSLLTLIKPTMIQSKAGGDRWWAGLGIPRVTKQVWLLGFWGPHRGCKYTMWNFNLLQWRPRILPYS